MALARTAVRVMSLKLVLLSASLAVFGAALPEPALEEASFGGMKLMHLILGTAGAGVTLWFNDKLDAKILGATITCGIVCAVAGTPFLAYGFIHWFTETPRAALPGPAENLLAVALGAMGLYLIPGLQKAAKAFKEDPLAFIERLRRGGPPPNGGGQP